MIHEYVHDAANCIPRTNVLRGGGGGLWLSRRYAATSASADISLWTR